MEEEQNKRRAPRIKNPYMLKFRQIDPKPDSDQWDMSQSLNISSTGICFNTMKQYSVGAKLEIFLSNPILEKDGRYVGRIIRSEQSHKLKMFHETVVEIEDIDENSKEAFYQSLRVALEKEGNDSK